MPEFNDYFKKYKRYYHYLGPVFRKKTVKSYTYLILTFFTASFFAFSAIKPTVVTITKLNRKISDARYSNQLLEEKIKTLSLGQELISSLGNDLNVLGESLPKKTNLDRLINQIKSVSLNSSTKITSLSFSVVSLREEKNSINQRSLRTIPFQITVEGEYLSLLSFIENIQQLRRLITIEEITITKKTEKEGVFKLNLSSKVNTYQLK